MMRFFYDWLVSPPAKAVAELLSLILGGLLPFAAAAAAGFGSYYLLKPDRKIYPYQWWAIVIGCTLFAVYVLIVMVEAYEVLPTVIFKFLRED